MQKKNVFATSAAAAFQLYLNFIEDFFTEEKVCMFVLLSSLSLFNTLEKKKEVFFKYVKLFVRFQEPMTRH